MGRNVPFGVSINTARYCTVLRLGAHMQAALLPLRCSNSWYLM